MVYKHAAVAAFLIYAQHGEDAAKTMYYIVKEITLLFVEIHGKSWNCAFEFLWEPWSVTPAFRASLKQYLKMV